MNIQNASENFTVLVIDDDIIVIDMMQLLFEDECQVISANNAADGIETALATNPDLILLDVRMPEMDGYEACKVLQDNPLTASIPVVFLTAKIEVYDEMHGLELGAIDYITKPIVPEIVKARVRNHLQQKRQRDLLAIQSTTDSLTGIANRRRLDEFLEIEWRRAVRNESTISLIMIDIDYFKNFNDTYGHTEGDKCLKMVATEILKNTRRPSDLVARYGGEEFCVVLPETASGPAADLGERIRADIEALNIANKGAVGSDVVTIAAGVATASPGTNDRLKKILDEADRQLYLAKDAGRNRVFTSEI